MKRSQEWEALERRLTECERELERARNDLQQFAYSASHDLQEPLRLIAGYSQLLHSRYHGTLDDKAHTFLDFITGSVRQMEAMLKGLTEFSRVETHGGPFVPTRLDDALDRALGHLQHEIRQSGARISRTPLPDARVDPEQIERLFWHLIGNAIRFRSDAPPDIHLAASREEQRWRILVRDNGIGIPARFAERVFVVFQRLQPRDQSPGSGVGLSVCKRIVERHGGTIWVDATPAQGTTIGFSLPDRHLSE
ncbi:MAG: hypothetical protein HQM03_12550 [Magnetococcales bacterium]|nr:hypothetical protein [Magnetococcales bacterium]